MDLRQAAEIFNKTEKELRALRHASAIINHDGMTCAPRNSAEGRASTLAALSARVHALTSAEEYFEAVNTLLQSPDELDCQTVRAAELALKEAKKLRSIPREVFAEHRRRTGQAFALWQEAKKNNDFPLLAHALEKVFESAADIARCAEPSSDPYDYWLNENEEGLSREKLEPFFAELMRELPKLIGRAAACQKRVPSLRGGHYPVEKQRELSETIMRLMGIDRMSCAIGEAEHPYTSAISSLDVRITTHYYENDATANMFSVLHEGGHALYALGISPELAGTRLAHAASAGLNESQSRFYENVIGRSKAFCGLIMPHLKRLFPESFGGLSEEELFRAVNTVRPSLKRTQADELTYPVHIYIRCLLEDALLHGRLPIEELPAEWNRLYKELLDIDVPDDASGCMQDMHWPSGLIGYFPTYALGNAYAAQILCAMQKELDIEALVAAGEIPKITAWLRERIHRYGRLKTPEQIICGCCGKRLDAKAYLDYLKGKHSDA